MAVTQGQFSKWPESVSFKRMMRELLRAQQYVPPRQDPVGSMLAMADDSSNPRSTIETPDFTPLAESDWTLGQNARGDFVARHVSGAERVIAER